METIKICVECPYCGKKSYPDLGLNVWGTIVTCPIDEDSSLKDYGCEQKFVVRLKMSPESIKIDGFGLDATVAGGSKPIAENLK